MSKETRIQKMIFCSDMVDDTEIETRYTQDGDNFRFEYDIKEDGENTNYVVEYNAATKTLTNKRTSKNIQGEYSFCVGAVKKGKLKTVYGEFDFETITEVLNLPSALSRELRIEYILGDTSEKACVKYTFI